MRIFYESFFPAAWLIWSAYWWALSRNVKPVVREESALARLSHILPLVVAAYLLAAPVVRVPVLGERFMPWTPWTFWIGAALTVAGLLFSVWARVHLGRNWSGIVTVKQDHELITSGPYAIVRHPIYTGLLLAFIGSAIARGEWRGVVAVAITWWAFYAKMRREERFMCEQFGDAYQGYCERVPALVPFLR